MPQDGKIEFRRFSRLKIELRIATLPTAGGEEDMVIRILAGGEAKPIGDILLSAENERRVKRMLARPHGLVFAGGPTGSGKTTTLHSMLAHVNTPERKIWTVEDPVEITQKGLRQVQLQPKIGLDFPSVLRAFLRADPDVIMVGEMRDIDTTSVGIEASLTGHLVLSTLHTNSAVESVVRLLEMGMDPYNFADALLGVLAQRLVRRLCPECKQPLQADENEIRKLADEYSYDFETVADERFREAHSPAAVLNAWKQQYAGESGRFMLFQPGGCKRCDSTGYSGRVAIHEVMITSDRIRQAIFHRATARELAVIALEEGMRTLRQDGIEKILQGHIDMAQLRKVCAQ
jgi:type II secretory ATPase GspE/PulE/Tfp pilus assembly ATPase PilB-like protein